MLADFVVLIQNPFDAEGQMIHQILPTATGLGGQLVSGNLQSSIDE